jgi:Zinc-binding dehydrogenase
MPLELRRGQPRGSRTQGDKLTHLAPPPFGPAHDHFRIHEPKGIHDDAGIRGHGRRPGQPGRRQAGGPVSYGPGLEDRVRAAAPDRVTAVLDAFGGEALDVSVRIVEDKTRIVTIADWSAPARLGIRRIGTDRSAARLGKLTRLYADGKLIIPVWKTPSLEKAADAHREVETRHVRGKVALTAG